MDLDESNVRDHISAMHLNYFPFLCFTCKKIGASHATVTAELMYQHTSTVHEGIEKPDVRFSIFDFQSKQNELNAAIENFRRPPAEQISQNGSKITLPQTFVPLSDTLTDTGNAASESEVTSTVIKQECEVHESTHNDNIGTTNEGLIHSTQLDNGSNSTNYSVMLRGNTEEQNDNGSRTSIVTDNQCTAISNPKIEPHSEITDECQAAVKQSMGPKRRGRKPRAEANNQLSLERKQLERPKNKNRYVENLAECPEYQDCSSGQFTYAWPIADTQSISVAPTTSARRISLGKRSHVSSNSVDSPDRRYPKRSARKYIGDSSPERDEYNGDEHTPVPKNISHKPSMSRNKQSGKELDNSCQSEESLINSFSLTETPEVAIPKFTRRRGRPPKSMRKPVHIVGIEVERNKLKTSQKIPEIINGALQDPSSSNDDDVNGTRVSAMQDEVSQGSWADQSVTSQNMDGSVRTNGNNESNDDSGNVVVPNISEESKVDLDQSNLIFRNMMFVLTSAPRSNKNSDFAKRDCRTKIEERGGKIIEDFSALQEGAKAFLIADTYYRTHKYLLALSLSIPCVKHNWIQDCVINEMLLDHTPYMLPAGESFLEVGKIYDWKPLKGSLLKGKHVWIYCRSEPSKGGFVDIWSPIIGNLGATLVKDVPNGLPEKLEYCRTNSVDILLSDATCEEPLAEAVEAEGGQAVNSEWVIQCLITGELPDVSSCERFRFNSAD
ncbi:regulator of ty1 transposition protein BRCT domain-containing protein [Ditylenchus destructor]|nr:regulator of ty1 transposition protein BRCT domain-containing protein [Ditylenchus destructor]